MASYFCLESNFFVPLFLKVINLFFFFFTLILSVEELNVSLFCKIVNYRKFYLESQYLYCILYFYERQTKRIYFAIRDIFCIFIFKNTRCTINESKQ